MKTFEEFLELIKSGVIHQSTIDKYKVFLTDCQLTELGFPVKAPVEGEPQREYKEYTRENVIAELGKIIGIGFDFAYAHRGVSSAWTYQIVCIYNQILDEGMDKKLAKDSMFGYYGLPLLKETAIKYGFNNPIGDDEGREDKYALQPSDFELSPLLTANQKNGKVKVTTENNEEGDEDS